MTDWAHASGALLLAWTADRLFGEPRSAWHPVAWFGHLAAPLGLHARTLAPPAALAAGIASWLVLVGSVATVGFAVEQAVASFPAWAAIPLLALVLKPTFAWRMLEDEVRAVDAALGRGLDEGRARVARLCSRDVASLDVGGVRETAIETLAENVNDSLVAPLFWFVVAGLPGAWAWRAVNTLDAMWGYRGHWEWAGKWAARTDDVMGWIPARLSAVLLWLPARHTAGLADLAREARRTPSPNGGWPMAAMALCIGARLGKAGVYTLHARAPVPDAAAMTVALAMAGQAARRALACTLLVLLTAGLLQAAPW
jgi:adenosylcobinamide-phosphate synthase